MPALVRQQVGIGPVVAEVERARHQIAWRQAATILAARDREGTAVRGDDRSRVRIAGAVVGAAIVSQVVGGIGPVRRGQARPTVIFVGDHRLSARPAGAEELARDDVLGIAVGSADPELGFGPGEVEPRDDVDDAGNRVRSVDRGGTVGDDLDPLDRRRRNHRNIAEHAREAAERRPVAVQQDKRRSGAEPAQVYARTGRGVEPRVRVERSSPVALVGRTPEILRDGLGDVLRRGIAAALNRLPIDDRHGRAHRARPADAGSGDDDLARGRSLIRWTVIARSDALDQQSVAHPARGKARTGEERLDDFRQGIAPVNSGRGLPAKQVCGSGDAASGPDRDLAERLRKWLGW